MRWLTAPPLRCCCPDVWAFGILMWEMYTGFRAHQGKKVGNIIFVVTSGQGKLELPPEAAEEYKVRVAPMCPLACVLCPHPH